MLGYCGRKVIWISKKRLSKSSMLLTHCNECRARLSDVIADNKERGKKVEPGIIHWNERQYASLICLPDTVKVN